MSDEKVFVASLAPVLFSVTVMVAPATSEPVGSVTTPLMAARNPLGKRGAQR